MEIDFCVVATLRPTILKQTLDSVWENIVFPESFNVSINVDCVPIKGVNILCENTLEIGCLLGVFATRYINPRAKNLEIYFDKGNFAKAVKKLWERTTADYVFHLEDDWKFIKRIDLNKCIERMEKENFDYMRFPKINAPHLNCLHKVALQPSLWKGSVVRKIAKHMRIDKDPEKQLRTGQGNEPLDKILFELQKKGLKDYCSEWCCVDIGREWREERGLVKWNKNKDNKEITWVHG